MNMCPEEGTKIEKYFIRRRYGFMLAGWVGYKDNKQVGWYDYVSNKENGMGKLIEYGYKDGDVLIINL